jgi:hypothetical protein
MKGLFTSLLFFTVVVTVVDTHGQSFYSFRRDRDFLISFGSGTASYFGEMVNPGELGELKANIAVGAEYYLSNRLSTRADLTWFQVSGNDADASDDRIARNLSFRSPCVELAFTGNIYLIPQGVRFYQRPKLNPYVFVGIGLLYMNPTTRDSMGVKHALQPLMTENVKYSKFQPVVPLGLGVKVKLNPFFNLAVEGGYRKTFTDYLDDVSSARYVKLDDLKNQSAAARELSDRRRGDNAPLNDEQRPNKGRRGNPGKDDSYFLINVKVQYYLPHSVFGNSQRKLYRSKRKGYYNYRKR